MNKRILGACAALALLAPSCQVVAAAGLGFALSQEFTENAHSLRIASDLETTWQAAQQSLDSLSLDQLKIDDKNHVVQGVVRGAQVTARVSAHSGNETVLSVTAKSYGRYHNDLAQDILFRVRDRAAR